MSEWIKWEGGECPVAYETLVEIQTRDGTIYEKDHAGEFYWGNDGCSSDIVAYRLADCSTINDGEEMTPTGIEAQVCKDIAERQAKGIAKYGVKVADNPLTHKQWLQHAYEEALDMAVYLKRAMERTE